MISKPCIRQPDPRRMVMLITKEGRVTVSMDTIKEVAVGCRPVSDLPANATQAIVREWWKSHDAEAG